MNLARRTSIVGTAVAALLGIALLAGCTGPVKGGAVYAGNDPVKTPTTTEPTTPPPGIAHPAAIEKGTGAPVVRRSGELPDAKKATVSPTSFTGTAKFSDGVELSVSGFTRGTVTSHGTGIITGAPFIVFTVDLKNGSKAPLSLNAVIPTLRYGSDATIAAPLYTDVKASDFTGTVKAGATATAVYAYQFPKGQKDASLYIDLDGAHKVAAFTGSIPK